MKQFPAQAFTCLRQPPKSLGSGWRWGRRRNDCFGIACDAQHLLPGPQVDQFGSDKSHSSKVAGCSVNGWAFGGLARFLLLTMVTLTSFLPTPLGSRSKLLEAR